MNLKGFALTALLAFYVFPAVAQMICFDYPADVFPTPGFPTAIVAADFNGDLYDDLAVSHYDEECLTIMLNDGTGHFPDYTTYSTEDANGSTILATDVNNDSIVDLLIMGRYYDIFVFTGDGDGTFTQAQMIFTDCWIYDGVAGDFNEDGNIDLAVTDLFTPLLKVFLGNGHGSFQHLFTSTTLGYTPWRILTDDFNKDGHSDLVVCNEGDDLFWGISVVMFPGTGLGTFRAPVILDENHIPESAVSGDFNMDGHKDIIFKQFDRHLAKLWGNGDGTFQETEFEEVSAVYYSLYLHEVDINLDGFPDLGIGGHYFNMHINDGSGNFLDTLNINQGSNWNQVFEIATGHFNGDTKPDVAATNYNHEDFNFGAVTIYMNCFPTGIPAEDLQSERILLSPNPGNGYFTVTTGSEPGPIEVTGIFNILGMVVSDPRIKLSGQTLDLTSLQPGLYFVRLKTGKAIHVQKVVVL